MGSDQTDESDDSGEADDACRNDRDDDQDDDAYVLDVDSQGPGVVVSGVECVKISGEHEEETGTDDGHTEDDAEIVPAGLVEGSDRPFESGRGLLVAGDQHDVGLHRVEDVHDGDSGQDDHGGGGLFEGG